MKVKARNVVLKRKKGKIQINYFSPPERDGCAKSLL